MQIAKKLILDDHFLEWVSEINYLGILIRNSKAFTCSNLEAKSNFYRSVNSILHNLGSNPQIDVALNLTNKICLPMLLYGLGAITISGTELKKFSFAYNSISCKLFKVNKSD